MLAWITPLQWIILLKLVHPYPFTPYFYFSTSNYCLLIHHSCPYKSVGYWSQDLTGVPKSTNAQVPWLSYQILRIQIYRFIKPPIRKLVQNLAGWICGWGTWGYRRLTTCYLFSGLYQKYMCCKPDCFSHCSLLHSTFFSSWHTAGAQCSFL